MTPSVLEKVIGWFNSFASVNMCVNDTTPLRFQFRAELKRDAPENMAASVAPGKKMGCWYSEQIQ